MSAIKWTLESRPYIFSLFIYNVSIYFTVLDFNQRREWDSDTRVVSLSLIIRVLKHMNIHQFINGGGKIWTGIPINTAFILQTLSVSLSSIYLSLELREGFICTFLIRKILS